MRNNAATAGFESEEEMERQFFIHFAPGEPPTITVTRINALPFHAGDALIVAGPQIVVEGQIASRQPLLRAECGVLDEELRLSEPQPIWEQVPSASAGAVPDRSARQARRGGRRAQGRLQLLESRPGRSALSITRNCLSCRGSRSMHPARQGVFHRRPLASPSRWENQPMSWRIRLGSKIDSQPSAGAKLIDDRSIGQPGTRKLTWKVPLHFGENHLAVFVTNGFSSFRSETAVVAVKQVPGRVEVTTVEPLSRAGGRPRCGCASSLEGAAAGSRGLRRRAAPTAHRSPVRAVASRSDAMGGRSRDGRTCRPARMICNCGAATDGRAFNGGQRRKRWRSPPSRATRPRRSPFCLRGSRSNRTSSGVPIVFTVTPKELLGSAQIFLVNGDREQRLEAPNPRDNGDLRIVNVQLPEGPQTIRVRIIENGEPVGAPEETQVSVLRAFRARADFIAVMETGGLGLCLAEKGRTVRPGRRGRRHGPRRNRLGRRRPRV